MVWSWQSAKPKVPRNHIIFDKSLESEFKCIRSSKTKKKDATPFGRAKIRTLTIDVEKERLKLDQLLILLRPEFILKYTLATLKNYKKQLRQNYCSYVIELDKVNLFTLPEEEDQSFLNDHNKTINEIKQERIKIDKEVKEAKDLIDHRIPEREKLETEEKRKAEEQQKIDEDLEKSEKKLAFKNQFETLIKNIQDEIWKEIVQDESIFELELENIVGAQHGGVNPEDPNDALTKNENDEKVGDKPTAELMSNFGKYLTKFPKEGLAMKFFRMIQKFRNPELNQPESEQKMEKKDPLIDQTNRGDIKPDDSIYDQQNMESKGKTDQTQRKVVKQDDFISDQEKEKETDQSEFTSSNFTNNQQKSTSFLDQPSTGTIANTCQIATHLSTFGKFRLPTFSGDLTTWRNFKHSFDEFVHKNEQLTSIVKFHFLKSYLIGEAFECVKGYQLTSKNYQLAWESLKRRYDQKDFIINKHLRNLVRLPKTIQNASAQHLQSLVNATNEVLQVFPSLDVSIDQWDSLLSFIIFPRLDRSTRNEWRQYLYNIGKDELPLTDLIKFIEEKIITLQQEHRQKDFHINKKKNPKMQCYFCRKNHPLYMVLHDIQ